MGKICYRNMWKLFVEDSPVFIAEFGFDGGSKLLVLAKFSESHECNGPILFGRRSVIRT
nr:MAG TPA: hypothetical protein [Caudoviricetes sp.]